MGKVDCYYFKTRVSHGGLSMDCPPHCGLTGDFCPIYEHGERETCERQLPWNEEEKGAK